MSLTKGAKTQEQIISKTILLFAKHGYENTSFQMIADVCKISRAAPVYHFKTKFGLFEAIIKHLHEKKMSQILSKDHILITDNAYEKIKKYFKGVIGWNLISTSEAEVFLLLFYFAAHDNQFAKLYHKILLTERQILEEFLLAGKRENIFHFIEDYKQVASSLYDLLLGFSVNSLAGRFEVLPMFEVDEKLMNIVRKLTLYKGG